LLLGAAYVLSTRRKVSAFAPVERAVTRQIHNDVVGVELLPYAAVTPPSIWLPTPGGVSWPIRSMM
jgi:hypothetical protein